MSTTYRICTLDELHEAYPSRVQRRIVAPATTVEIPPVEIDEKSLEVLKRPTAWESLSSLSRTELSYEVPDLCTWQLIDAEVHGRTGVVTVGDCAVAESLASNFNGFRRTGDGCIELTPTKRTRSMARAVHLLCEGDYNYHHYWFDGGGRLMLCTESERMLPLLACTEALFQQEILTLFASPAGRHHQGPAAPQTSLPENETVRVAQLTYPGDLFLIERYAPHPFIRQVAYELGNREVIAGGRSQYRRIYMSRVQAHRRRMINEHKLQEALTDLGFIPLIFEQLNVYEQIRIMAGAEVVVTPHGSGLINAMFGPPGLRSLELFPHDYINWPNRYIAQLPLRSRYGAIIAPDSERTVKDDGHSTRWNIDIEHVLTTLER